MFASVAYSWTFYNVLALLVATRDLVRTRLALAQPEPFHHIRKRAATWTPKVA